MDMNVETYVKKDLIQQMKYYKSLGEDNLTDEQMANNAYMLIQGKGGNLSDRQMQFVNDIFYTYRLLMQIAQLDRQFNSPRPLPGLENNPAIINNSPPKSASDSKTQMKK